MTTTVTCYKTQTLKHLYLPPCLVVALAQHNLVALAKYAQLGNQCQQFLVVQNRIPAARLHLLLAGKPALSV